VITVARPPKIYFIAKRARNWKEVTNFLEEIIFDVATPQKELDCYLAIRQYALSVYYQFHRPNA
jgi:hypothetical protein